MSIVSTSSVKLRDVLYDHSSSVLLVMNYLKNGNLLQYINNLKPNKIQCLEMMNSILKAVWQLHTVKYVHRDLKLENILVNEGGEPILADYGFAIDIKDDHMGVSTCGSLHYTCPEVLLGRYHNMMKSDIFSLGVMAYAMITRQFPFDGEKNKDICRKIIEHRNDVIFPSYVDDSIKQMITMMMHRFPELRPPLHELVMWNKKIHRNIVPDYYDDSYSMIKFHISAL